MYLFLLVDYASKSVCSQQISLPLSKPSQTESSRKVLRFSKYFWTCVQLFPLSQTWQSLFPHCIPTTQPPTHPHLPCLSIQMGGPCTSRRARLPPPCICNHQGAKVQHLAEKSLCKTRIISLKRYLNILLKVQGKQNGESERLCEKKLHCCGDFDGGKCFFCCWFRQKMWEKWESTCIIICIVKDYTVLDCIESHHCRKVKRTGWYILKQVSLHLFKLAYVVSCSELPITQLHLS